jgi:hypothetical protein
MHPDGPATGRLDQSFPWFPSVLEQMLSLYPKSTSLCMLVLQPYPEFRIFVKKQPSKREHIIVLPSKHTV